MQHYSGALGVDGLARACLLAFAIMSPSPCVTIPFISTSGTNSSWSAISPTVNTRGVIGVGTSSWLCLCFRWTGSRGLNRGLKTQARDAIGLRVGGRVVVSFAQSPEPRAHGSVINPSGAMAHGPTW